MRNIIVLLILTCYSSVLFAQDKSFNYGSLTGAIGSGEGSVSADFFHLWKVGKKDKIEAGIGARFNSYFGTNQYYSSAPANLANDEKKTDSVRFARAQVNAFNLAINFGYRLSTKIGLGFNIDFLGFSFGGKKDGTYINGNQIDNTTAKPTSFNVLLVGNNDHGMLNSEFYGRYFFSDRIALKVAFQYLFTEYTTDTPVQQQPESNDRFRNKSAMVSVGITRKF
ncbi:MAG: hypothetical protein ACOYXT_10530 [Bacteroidota bacterium]